MFCVREKALVCLLTPLQMLHSTPQPCRWYFAPLSNHERRPEPHPDAYNILIFFDSSSLNPDKNIQALHLPFLLPHQPLHPLVTVPVSYTGAYPPLHTLQRTLHNRLCRVIRRLR
jgi:hypothetical protein